MSRVVEIRGKRISLTHLKCFRRMELERWLGREEAERLVEVARKHITAITPLYATLHFMGRRITLSPGPSLVSGVEFRVTPEPLETLGELDEDFLYTLLFEVPEMLDVERRPVLVERLDERFTQRVEEGVRYALDVVERISRVYRIPFIVTGQPSLLGVWGWHHTLVRVFDERHRPLVLLDGWPLT